MPEKQGGQPSLLVAELFADQKNQVHPEQEAHHPQSGPRGHQRRHGKTKLAATTTQVSRR